ncbi:MAG: hypothetical protein MRY21_08160 [Simkaniaceae bacterium]|nr:hypothetical protein [Simkaniaceae bacterium]
MATRIVENMGRELEEGAGSGSARGPGPGNGSSSNQGRLNPGHMGPLVADLMNSKESLFFEELSSTRRDLDDTSSELYTLVEFMRHLRKVLQEQKGRDVNIVQTEQHHALVDNFLGVYTKMQALYPTLLPQESHAIFSHYDPARFPRDRLEDLMTKVQNIQTKHQGRTQELTGGLETMTMEHKMITQILMEIAKMLNKSNEYYVKQSRNG